MGRIAVDDAFWRGMYESMAFVDQSNEPLRFPRARRTAKDDGGGMLKRRVVRAVVRETGFAVHLGDE